MRQLLVRLITYFGLVCVVAAGGWWCWCWLQERHNPQRAAAARILEDRLGHMTPEQSRLAGMAMKRDPLCALLTAESGGWEGLRHFVDRGPDEVTQIERIALSAGLHKQIDGPRAEKFTNAACVQYALLNQIDSQQGRQLLEQLNDLSPDEYSNVGLDPSYLLIVRRIDARHREVFRQHQSLLTPILAASDPSEWDRLLDKFQRALPRVAEIFRKDGLIYATIYMLHADLVDALVRAGITEPESLEFAGINAASAYEMNPDPNVVADTVALLPREKAQGGHTLLFWTLRDPAVFWLIVHIEKTTIPGTLDTQEVFTILKHYAGTVVPMILTKYADQDDCFRAAVEALVRFDNYGDKDPKKNSMAAKFLAHYQDDPAFKDELRKHGAQLVPAMSTGDGVLAAIQRNPHDIDKYVTVHGQPITGKPWWTWVPGGNIAYLGKEIAHGQSTSGGDWGWAAFDTLIFIPTSRGVMLLRLAPRAGEEAAIEAGAKVVATETVEAGTSLVARSATAMAGEVAAATVGRATLRESLLLLRNAGVKIGEKALYVAKGAVDLAARYPLGATAATLAVVYALYPEKVTQLGSGLEEGIKKLIEAGAKEIGTTAAAVPGDIIKAIWEKFMGLAAEEPMLAPLFYLFAAGLTVMVLLLPLLMLRLLLPEVFKVLQQWLAVVLRVLAAPIILLVRSLTKRPVRPA